MSNHFQTPSRHLGASSPRPVRAAPVTVQAATVVPAVQQAATDMASAAFVSQADALATSNGNATTGQKLNTAIAGTDANNAAADDANKTDALKASAAIGAILTILKFL